MLLIVEIPSLRSDDEALFFVQCKVIFFVFYQYNSTLINNV